METTSYSPDPQVVDELRQFVSRGAGAIEAVQFLITKLSLTKHSQLIVIIYFRATFGICIGDAKALTAWHFFSGGGWTDEMVHNELSPILWKSVAHKINK